MSGEPDPEAAAAMVRRLSESAQTQLNDSRRRAVQKLVQRGLIDADRAEAVLSTPLGMSSTVA